MNSMVEGPVDLTDCTTLLQAKHGDRQARKMGKKIGKQAWRKALTYFHGTAGMPLDDSKRDHDDKEDDNEEQDGRD